jgi:coenzyme F420-0:L-glutamate ligase / coenzyme F420-1:gamma-L-glutamate ligase
MPMHIVPITTGVLSRGDDLAAAIMEHAELEPGDVIVVSSKAAATCEGTGYDLRSLRVSDEARSWAARSGLDPTFCEAVILESTRLNGRVVGACPMALLAELRPDGLPTGTLFAANAGLDRSNVPRGLAIGWPRDPVESARGLRAELEKRTSGQRVAGSGQSHVGIIISDSCCWPRRIGVGAYALATAGVVALRDEIGEPDLFGRPLTMTVEAAADQVAVAANIVMGNAAQGTPAAIVRESGIMLSDSSGWVPCIEPERDLFQYL